MISQPVRIGSKEGSSNKIQGSRQSAYSAQFKFKTSQSSNKNWTTTINNENSASLFMNKASYWTKTQIKEKLDKNTKTSYTKKAGRYSQILKIIKKKCF